MAAMALRDSRRRVLESVTSNPRTGRQRANRLRLPTLRATTLTVADFSKDRGLTSCPIITLIPSASADVAKATTS